MGTYTAMHYSGVSECLQGMIIALLITQLF